MQCIRTCLPLQLRGPYWVRFPEVQTACLKQAGKVGSKLAYCSRSGFWTYFLGHVPWGRNGQHRNTHKSFHLKSELIQKNGFAVVQFTYGTALIRQMFLLRSPLFGAQSGCIVFNRLIPVKMVRDNPLLGKHFNGQNRS